MRLISRFRSFCWLLLLVGLLGAGPKTAAPPANLKDRLDAMIDFSVDKRHPSSEKQAAWQIVHGLLSYGKDLEIKHEGKLIHALPYLLEGGKLKGWKLSRTDHGIAAATEPGSKEGQGHPDQWLGYLSQCGVTLDEPLIVDDKKYKILDLVAEAQWECAVGREATFTLMGFSKYLPLDATWKASDGSDWSMARLLDQETEPGIADEAYLTRLRETACGGSHRMYAVAAVVNRCLAEKQDMTGSWALAQARVKLAVQKAHEYQQPDGSLSAEFFTRAATSADLNARLHSTGHTLEFLALALDDTEVKAPWVENATVYLLKLLEHTKSIDLECGGLYHATHGLKLYRERLFGPRTSAATP